MKKGKTAIDRFVFPAILTGMFLLSGCMHDRTSGASSARKESDETIRICVMPFFKGRYPTTIDQPADRTWMCRLDELCYEETDLEGPADAILTRLAAAYLQNHLENRFVPLADAVRVFETMDTGGREDTLRSMAVRMGRQLSAEWVLAGTVWRYRERVGKSMGIEKPAPVAFTVFLVETETGRRLWQGVFDETQRSLSENVLKAPDFFRRGARWLTAEELARAGLEETFRSFPGLHP